jgi:hypothetical protein
MAKKARKYGEAWKDVSIDSNQFDAVYDKLIRSPSLDKASLPESNSLPDISSLPRSTSLPKQEGAKTSSLPKEADLDYRAGSLPNLSSLPSTDHLTTLLDIIPQVDGHLKLWYELIDHLYPQLTPNERAAHENLYRLSWGWDSPTCIVGLPKLAKRCNLAISTTQIAVNSLIEKRLIKKLGTVQGKGKKQGAIYEVIPPNAQLRAQGLPKTGRLPKSDRLPKSGTSIINTQRNNTQTQASVSVRSRFSSEECRRYAEHLKQTGQGITNPGGYATKIFCSGEADALIEAFLNPLAQVDISKCQDCRGTGFIYVDRSNHDRGVRPCKHTGLTEQHG